MAKVTMPQLGESVAEGTIGKWLKSPGDAVAKDEPLLEVITDKVNAEVPSPFEGILRKILVEEGQTVPFAMEIAEIEEMAGATPGGAGTAAAKAAAPGTVAVASAPAGALATPPAAVPPAGAPATLQATPQATPATPRGAGTADATRIVPVMDAGPLPAVGDPNARMTPAVRMMMREHGLSPAQVVGTGHAGRITRDDVAAFVERLQTGGAATGRGAATAADFATGRGAATAADQAAVFAPGQLAAPPGVASHSPGLASTVPSSPPAVSWEPGQDEVLIPHTQMRRGIAAQMTRAATIPVAHSTFEADMTAVVNLRRTEAEAYKAREGVGLSFLPFVVKAVVEALHASPDLNAHYTEAGLLRKRRINIGIAIAVEASQGGGGGLIVPVIRDADQLSINGINRAIQDLAARARANKLRLDDLGGGTFTIDNTGWFGSILTVPIINPPEVCILTTEAVVKRPVVRETEDGDVIAVRSMMNLVAGYDHRATDGAQVGRFVRDVICWLEAVGPDTSIY